LRASPNKAGLLVACPRCHHQFHVPSDQPQPERSLLVEAAGEPNPARPTSPRKFSPWSWLLAGGAGLVLAITSEVVLLFTWAEGNHHLSGEIDRKYDVPALHQAVSRNHYQDADRDFPWLPWAQRNRIAEERYREDHDRWQEAVRKSSREYSMLFDMRKTRLIIYSLASLVVCFSLPFGVLFWLKQKRRRP
jgi:hypothetical protein